MLLLSIQYSKTIINIINDLTLSDYLIDNHCNKNLVNLDIIQHNYRYQNYHNFLKQRDSMIHYCHEMFVSVNGILLSE